MTNALPTSMHRTAEFSVVQAAYWNWALQHKGRIDDQPEVIEKVTVEFGDGYEVDIKLCNCDDPDSTPYVDCVLFIDGCEAATCEPDCEEIQTGEWHFPDAKDGMELNVTARLADLSDYIAQIENTVAQPEIDDFDWLRDTVRPMLENLSWATGTVPTNPTAHPGR